MIELAVAFVLGGVLVGASFIVAPRLRSDLPPAQDIDKLLDMAEMLPATVIRSNHRGREHGVVVTINSLKIVLEPRIELEYENGLLHGITVSQRRRARRIGMSKIAERLDQHATRFLLGPAGEENME